MSSLVNRLRDIVGSGPPGGAPHEINRGPYDERDSRDGQLEAGRNADAVAEMLGGSWADAHGQRYVVIDRSYSPGHRHGRVAMMDCLPPWPRLPLLGGPEPLGAEDERAPLLFIDLETTGITGGAGAYAFLVGCAWFDGPTFRTRQFFLSTYAGERALLDGVAQLARGISGVVSFNGKSFDLPLIETRYLFHRLQTPFAGVPHVDMLHPARRLWRADEDEAAGTTASCPLGVLEQALLRTQRRCAPARTGVRAQPARPHLAGAADCRGITAARGGPFVGANRA
jgi:uncharacterized protein YprB with RNaseH-like and TPR domain